MARSIGLLLMILLVPTAILGKGSLFLFIDVPSFLIVVGGTVGALLFSFGSGFGTALRALFRASVDKHTLQTGIEFYDRAKTYLIAWGVIGFFLGMVLMLANLTDPDSLGPGLAVSLITVFYGLIFGYGLCMPITCLLQGRLDRLEQPNQNN
jgi:flagellar motor component MotA